MGAEESPLCSSPRGPENKKERSDYISCRRTAPAHLASNVRGCRQRSIGCDNYRTRCVHNRLAVVAITASGALNTDAARGAVNTAHPEVVITAHPKAVITARRNSQPPLTPPQEYRSRCGKNHLAGAATRALGAENSPPRAVFTVTARGAVITAHPEA